MVHTASVRAVSLACLVAAAQAFPQKRSAFTRQGCFVDKPNNGPRLLDSKSYSSDSMTVESCAAFCSKYKFFAVEYGRECYCGDTHSGLAIDNGECSTPCAGNKNEKCGGGLRAEIYTNNLYSSRKPATLDKPYHGCFIDQGARILPDNLIGADDMTAEKCAAHCADYSYFGVEYGRECWCGNAPPITLTAESECSFPCAGDDTQLCGAGGRINVWGAPLPSPPTVGDFEYLGCYTDSNSARSLTGKVVYDSAMTLDKCASACAAYNFFGVEFGTQCFCSTELKESASPADQAECSTRCGGDYGNVCGAPDRLNVFASKDCKEDPASATTVGGFTYKSCWVDSNSARALSGPVHRANDMTAEVCAAFCKDFKYFGLEYGSQCFCGNELNGVAAVEGECSYVCEGNAKQWCGAADRLNVYGTTPDPTPVVDAPAVTVTPV